MVRVKTNATIWCTGAAMMFVVFASVGPWIMSGADGVRVLAVETIAGKSHWNFMRAVLRALTDNGHEVVVFTPFADGNRENYTEVDMSAEFPIKLDMDLSEIREKFSNPTSLLPMIVTVSRTMCDIIYDNKRMKDVLRRDGRAANFDLVIAEPLGLDCVSYVATKLDLPLIYVVPSPMITHHERSFFGHVPNPAAVSHLLAGHAVPRSFTQRFGNAVLSAYAMFVIKCTGWNVQPRPYDLVPPARPALVFVNTEFTTEAPRPVPPNVVHVGGLHLDQPKTILPHDVLEFIEESPNGVIYFTFGSVVKMSTLPDHILKAFKEALAEVPQRVLWKYEGEMEDVPKNVMIKNWFPQRDILMHPKIKLFISHGGISGIYETVDAAVPVLGFPVFYDQHRNIANLVDAGMAISMELMSVSKDTFLSSILELINNEKYTKNAKITSERFKDRPMSPEKLIVYWTEYIYRHKGAPHLKSHALNLTWYQYFLLDVIAVLLISIFVIFFISHKMVKLILKYSLKHLKNIKVKSE